MLKKIMLTTLAVLLTNSGFAVEKKVRVESPFQYTKDKNGKTVIQSSYYRDSRPAWGVRLNFATSQIELAKEIGGEKDGTPFQVDIGISRNFEFFSVGPEIGFLSAKFENTASVTGFSLGGAFYLDGLFKTAYLVPFASGGVLSLKGDIDQLDAATNTTKNFEIDFKEIVPYYRAGLLIGLNWLDRATSRNARSDYGLQNSFIYVAARKITATNKNEGLFNLETKFYTEFGLQVEF